MQRRFQAIVRRIALLLAEILEAVVVAEREGLDNPQRARVSQMQVVATSIGVCWFALLVVLAGLGLDWLACLWVGLTVVAILAVLREFPANLRRELRRAIFRPEPPPKNPTVRWVFRLSMTLVFIIVLVQAAREFGYVSLGL